MKDILCGKFSHELTINGVGYEIDPDFRLWIHVSKIIGNIEHPDNYDEIMKAFLEISKLIFPYEMPPIFSAELVNQVMDFLNCGENKSSDSAPTKKEFDFEYDAGLIYASFVKDYGIRLKNEKMHWWEFLALFSSLSEGTSFSNVLRIRGMKASDVASEKRSEFLRIQRKFALPVSEKESEMKSNFANALKNMGKQNG